MSLAKHYTPADTEAKWYSHWLEQNYFHSEPDHREPYTIVIPPPNVTGVLHMGHMLNITIQDILIRQARLAGKNACWVPGTDHASIATEAKVVRQLREKGIKKSDLSRDEFLQHAWAWKEEYGGKILGQLQRLGASCDWERTRFTLEESLSEAVVKVFNDLYKKGKLYRGLRMTNWDPEAQTVLSNEEVIHADEDSLLYHVRYRIEGTDEYITIATQRPETIMADTGLAVNPKDERYLHLHGKRVVVPLVERSVPIITDSYVDLEFGTGALKITPAHDPNDYDLGQKYELEVIDTIAADGTLNEKARFGVGLDRFEARKFIVKLLDEKGHLVGTENYRTRIGRSERTNAVVEPRLTLQWFLRMDEFAATALEAVRSEDVRFFPENMWNMYQSWLKEENVRDWCISRQLWWGQRIPAWYLADPNLPDAGEPFVAETAEAALELARTATGNADLQISDLHQDEDVVDTWFSSWLWPISVFDGFKTQEELRYYYPTNTLVTGWDIMFFWVARMIMAGYEWAPELLGEEFTQQYGAQPFHHVYFTGMVRDSKRRKMSKSLGNSPDALALLDKYGADGVRFGMLSSGAAGNDIIFDAPIDPKTGKVRNESKLCEQGRNFCNKMWNALKLIDMWELTDTDVPPTNRLAYDWLHARLHETIGELNSLLQEFRLSDALMTLYKFIWDDFCSWYLEMIKPAYGEPLDQTTYDRTIQLYERLLILLHPFMPFVTEEIWHNLRDREAGDDLAVAKWPEAGFVDVDIVQAVERLKQAVTAVREVRNDKGIKMSDPLTLTADATEANEGLLAHDGIRATIEKMANLESLSLSGEEPENAVQFLVGNDKFFLVLNQTIDVAAEREKLQKELEYIQGFVAMTSKKLSNQGFVDNAPAAVVDRERQKLADGQTKLQNLEEALARLG